MTGTVPPPNGFTLLRLADVSGPAHVEARAFALSIIKEFYGYDYRPDWHGDLDSLLKGASESHFSSVNDGAFWTLHDKAGDMAATTAIKRLTWHPNVLQSLPGRYSYPEKVATLMRAYVRKDLRGAGIGRYLNDLCETEARRLGYETLYLHANTDTPATIAFWTKRGYTPIGSFSTATHFDKPLR